MATTETTQPSADYLAGNRRTFAYGLWWAAAMLVILGRWLDAKYASISPLVVYGFYTWAAILFGQGLRQVLPSAVAMLPAEQKNKILLNQRRTLGLTLVLWGLLGIAAALGIAVWQAMQASGGFSFSQVMETFPETFGLAILSFISLAAGRSQLRQPSVAMAPQTLENLLPKIPALSLSFIAVGAVFIGLAVWLFFIRKVRLDEGFPELGMFALLGIIGLWAGLWLFLKPREEISADRLRIFFLVVGGAAGLVIAIMTLARAWAWREELFFGGISAWQREGAWRIWLLGYVELFGLTFMFASLLLARADIRKNAVLRRTLYGYNAVVNGLLVIAILVLVNIVAYAALPYRFDWSGTRGIYTLHSATKNLLAGLKEPTSVYVMLSQSREGIGDVRTLLENAQAETNLLKIRYVSSGLHEEDFTKLLVRFPEIRPEQQAARFGDVQGGILLVYGKTPEQVEAMDPKKEAAELAKIAHTFIPANKIFETPFDPHTKQQRTLFRGEEEIVKEIRFLAENKTKRQIYFLQGNDELDINISDAVPRGGNLWMPMRKLGIGHLVKKLEDDNFDVKGLDFGKKPLGKPEPKTTYVEASGAEKRKEVPDDAWAVIVAAPGKPVDKEVFDALDRYMQKKGRMIILFDVIAERDSNTIPPNGFEEFVSKYSVQATNEFVMRVPLGAQDRNLVVIRSFTPHESKSAIAKRFDSTIQLLTARVVKPASGKGIFQAETFFAAPQLRDQDVWGEADLSALSDPFNYVLLLDKRGLLEKRITEPQFVPISVTVTEGDKPRMVVMGDADFVTNDLLTRTRDREVYYGIISSALDWLGDRPVIGIPPKQTSTFMLPGAIETPRLILMPLLLMSVSVLGLGIGVWVVRRR